MSPATPRGPGGDVGRRGDAITVDVAEIQAAMFEKHIPFIEQAGEAGVQVLCLQEIFNGPYFCPSQDARWYDAAEPVPGPTTAAEPAPKPTRASKRKPSRKPTPTKVSSFPGMSCPGVQEMKCCLRRSRIWTW